MKEYPKNCRYILINLQEPPHKVTLDLILDGNQETEIQMNGIGIKAKDIKIVELIPTGPQNLFIVVEIKGDVLPGFQNGQKINIQNESPLDSNTAGMNQEEIDKKVRAEMRKENPNIKV